MILFITRGPLRINQRILMAIYKNSIFVLISKCLLIALGAFVIFKIRFYVYHYLLFIISIPFLMFYFFYNSYDKDVTKSELYQNVSGHSYELIEDAFLFKDDLIDYLEIYAPGHMSGIPKTIEDYQKYGENWDQFYNKGLGYYKNHVLGILSKGTKIRVVKILKRSDGGNAYFILPFVKVLNGPHMEKEARILFISVIPCTYPPILEVDERFLKECQPD